MNKDREVAELRNIVEEIEDKQTIHSDDEDITVLKEILERKISNLKTEIETQTGSEDEA